MIHFLKDPYLSGSSPEDYPIFITCDGSIFHPGDELYFLEIRVNNIVIVDYPFLNFEDALQSLTYDIFKHPQDYKNKVVVIQSGISDENGTRDYEREPIHTDVYLEVFNPNF